MSRGSLVAGLAGLEPDPAGAERLLERISVQDQAEELRAALLVLGAAAFLRGRSPA